MDCIPEHTHTHTLIHSLTHIHTPAYTPTHTLTHTSTQRAHTQTHSLTNWHRTLTHTHSHKHIHTHSLTHSSTHTHIEIHTHTNASSALEGGRGWVRQVWNDSRPRYLADILAYNTSKDGYWSEWVDSMPYSSGVEEEEYGSRLRGFFVPPTSADYTLYLLCDDRCDLFFSNSTRPEDKVCR